MATTTTNYGFDVPTSSDLVKNGATQIALLGQDLDTFLFRPFTRNGVINSAMQIWQRGTSTTSTNGNGLFGADRWKVYSATTGRTISQQVTNDTTNLPNIQYCSRLARDNANTNTSAITYWQNFETFNTRPFSGQTVTLSFYGRKGANYSEASSNLNVVVRTGTGTDQDAFYSGYTGSTDASNTNKVLTTTWQRFTSTFAIAATATEMAIGFTANFAGTAGAADYVEITGVMLEVGSQASPYTPCTPTYATELAACQRYYFRSTPASSFGWLGSGVAQSTTVTSMAVTLPTTMRVVPTSVDFSTLSLVDGVTATAVTTCTIDSNVTSNNFGVVTASVASGLTQYRPYYLRQNSSSAGFIGFSAEL